MSSSSSFIPPAVSFPRRPQTGPYFGLTGPQVGLILTGGMIALFGSMLASGLSFKVKAGLWLFALALTALALIPIGRTKRPLAEWLPGTGSFFMRKVLGQTKYRFKPLKPLLTGSLRRHNDTRGGVNLGLGGDGGRVKVYTDPISGGAVLHDPVPHTLSAVMAVENQGFILQDTEEKVSKMMEWSNIIDSYSRSDDIAWIQVLERTIPDGGTGMREHWESQRSSDDMSEFVQKNYAYLMEHAAGESQRHETFIVLSLNIKAAMKEVRANGNGLTGAMTVLRARMRALEQQVMNFSYVPDGWINPDQLGFTLRTALDPANVGFLEQHENVGRQLGDGLLMAAEEHYNYFVTDSGFHQTLAVVEWPRSSQVPYDFLQNVLVQTNFRRTFSFYHKPIPMQKALTQAENKNTSGSALSVMKRRMKLDERAKDYKAAQESALLEDEIAEGYGVNDYTLLITVTALSKDALFEDISTLRAELTGKGMYAVPLYGEQAAAFHVAALPLGRGI